MRSTRAIALLSIAIAFLLSAAPDASAADATVSGTVVDQLGGAIENASVAVTRDGRPVTETKTDKAGHFEVAVAESGRYELQVTSPGFLTRVLDSFFVATGARVSQTITMSIGITQVATVTASATELPISQVAAPVTVLDRSTIESIGKPSVVEALRLVPGVHVVQAGARGASSSLFVRGGASYFNKVLIDGVPANDVGGAYDYADLSTVGIDRIEVLRDANSVLYGSDALAGVVSITTRRGTTRVPELSYAIDGGSLGTQSHELALGGTAQRVDYFASFSNFDTDNKVANNAYRNRKLAGRLGWTAGMTDISAVYRAGSARTGLPGTVNFFGLSDDSRKDANDQLFSITADSRISPRWHTMVRLAVAHSNYNTTNPTPTGEAFDPFGYGANYIGNLVTIEGANGYRATGRAILDYGGSYPTPYTATTNRQVMFGQATYRASDALGVSGGVRIEHEDGVTQYATSDPSSTDRNNSGAFVEAHGIVGRFIANAGLGFDDNAIFGFKTTPRVSVATYLRNPSSTDAFGDTKVTLNAGTGVKAPSIGQELSSLYTLVQKSGATVPGLAPLGPEEGRSFDAGIEQGLWQGRVRIRAAYFNNDFTNVLEYVNKGALTQVGVSPEAAAATVFGAYVNSSSYAAKGLELSGDVSVAPFRFSASYTFLDAEVTKSFSGDVLAPATNPNIPGVDIGAFSPLLGARPFRRPTHAGNFLTGYTQRALDVTVVGYISGKQDDSTYLSDQYFGNSMLLPNHNLAPGYAKLDLAAGYRLAPTLRWYISIENLLDKAYEAVAGFPALLRTFRTGVTVKLGGDRRP